MCIINLSNMKNLKELKKYCKRFSNLYPLIFLLLLSISYTFSEKIAFLCKQKQ